MSMIPTVEPHLEAPAIVDEDGLLAASLGPATRSASYSSLIWRRFRRNRVGMIGLILVSALLLVTIFSSFLSPYDPTARNRESIYLPPQAMHFFGTDGFQIVPFTHPITIDMDPDTFALKPIEDTTKACTPEFLGKGWKYTFLGIPMERHLLTPAADCPFHLVGTDRDGRDMLSRLLTGGKLTLLMAGFVVAVSVMIGTIVGIVSGYLGGSTDHWIQRCVEFILALPELPFYFALVAIIPRNADPFQVFLMLVGILACLKWAQLAREIRGKTMSIAQLDYITAAEAIGARTPRIVTKHILPNVMSHVVVATTLMIPSVVLLESFLSFLGIGVRPPLVSWGLLLNAASDLQNLGSYPWVLAPVGAILVTVMGFNMFGDGLRDAIDPYQN
ncbi:ABC transporter permease [Kaistia dalseonensis]|uniref:Peptide/nickel transport system permease protein n=1 Tax=Kaistia dalseonensis TaxID=410840 RepID=A0ABU0HDH1_9HYPH|nr:ABC transporter permease [Kaistia dalseonensis]MCX5497713.1 ABC transporter permease [Kaistia dalseonensis]MDQ0440357.1 peptide/nickel transport system permease protein [Kaistia dalseonensis]